jgi:superfamily II DNA or RNA helicase
MNVRIDSWAWLPKQELSISQLQALKHALTVEPRKFGAFEQEEEEDTRIDLFTETATHIGVAREYFMAKRRSDHTIEMQVSDGDKSSWPGDVKFAKQLRNEQQTALNVLTASFRSGKLGGMVKAGCGWGKTVYACAAIASLNVPTLIVVHKDFLMSQWVERINEYLPEAQVGIAQQKRCDYQGKNVVVGMVHSLGKGKYPEEFYRWPGLIIVDECHRIGARTWASVPPRFPARFRLGLSATPRRKDGAENVFLYHLGPVLFQAREQRLKPKVRRVFSQFRLVQTERFNPNLAPESLISNFLCANQPRNAKIVEMMIEAVKAGRKLLVLTKRLEHIARMSDMFQRKWREECSGPVPSFGRYVGGMSEEDRYESSKATVIFATAQFASEGLDIPALDTLFLTMPMSDIEQAVGRILRPFEGKKDPVVVDIRDDLIGMFAGYAQARERQYVKMC